jgi:serine/threonine protein kinase
MTIKTCNVSRLDSFLRNDMTQKEEQLLTSHLDECPACREELEYRAAEESIWQEASMLLGGSQPFSYDTSRDFRFGSTRSPQIESALKQLAPTDDPNSLGRIGSYEIKGVVGAGGMGVVLKAQDRSLDRIVAIKVMSPHLASSGAARKRFAREAKAAAAVLHPNVIAIHSVASEDSMPYLVMPFIRGTSLQKRIDSQGPLPLTDTLRIGSQIAAGLAAAHDQGLVHRDIKPANILLEEGVERITITDFGLARAVDDASMTCSGVIAGTPQYMSPEQARGEPIDARSDLFSLGSVLYAMCTGRSPFRAETTYGILHRIANDTATSVCDVNPDVPVWLEHIIQRLMAKRPGERFESAAQVGDLLEKCLAHVQQPHTSRLPQEVLALAPKKTRRPPIEKFIAAAVFFLVFALAGLFIVLELNKGTLTIQSDVDDVRVRITRGENVVNELKVTKGSKSVRVAAGQYRVEIIGDSDGLAVENGQVTLHRADTEIVNITLNDNDTNLPTNQSPTEAVQVPPSDFADSLAVAVDQFNDLRMKAPLNDQPVLTKDEILACASWNLEQNQELTETLQSALAKIAKRHQWPEGWRIEGNYLDLPPDATPVRAFRISLVHATTGEQFTIRERYLEPPPAFAKPVLNASFDGMQLSTAIKRFNTRYFQANGAKQPPLTENEVVAAIIYHQTKRDEADVSDSLFEKFQEIARTRFLPEDVSFEVIPTFGSEGGATYTIWSVRIKLFQDEAGKEGWTYAFTIREQFVSVKHGNAGEIHWGKPAENGLQAGVRLTPSLLSYELGQTINVDLCYRNILTKPISASVPNFSGYEIKTLDANDTLMDVLDFEEPLIVGGARAEQIGHEPTTSHCRSFAFAPTSLPIDKREEYRAQTGASILIFVEQPGKPYRLQFSAHNIADEDAGNMSAGEVEVTIEPEVAKELEQFLNTKPASVGQPPSIPDSTQNKLNAEHEKSADVVPSDVIYDSRSSEASDENPSSSQVKIDDSFTINKLRAYLTAAQSQAPSRAWVESQRGRIVMSPNYQVEGPWYVAKGALPLPKILVDTIGIDYFSSVKHVTLDCEEIYDLSKLVGLTQLEDLYINQHVHDVRVFDSLRELPRLKKILLSKWSGLSRAEIESIAKTLDHVEVVKEE